MMLRNPSASFFPLFALLFSFNTHATPTFDFNANCQQAYTEIFSLRLESGKELIATEKTQHPDNLIPILLESYVDLLTIITSDNQSLLTHLKEAKMDRLSALKKGDESSPWYRYTQAEVQLHYALGAFQNQEYLSGVMEMRKAYALLEENIKLHPGFKPNQKSFFTIQALLGAVPEKFAWGLRLLGLEGNLTQGMGNLKWLANENWGTDSLLKDEAVHIYAQLLFHLEGDKARAWEVLQKNQYPIEGNLFSYSTAIKIALYSFHTDTALALLEQAPQGKEYSEMPVLNYYAGIAHLNQLNTEEATKDFQRFAAAAEGKNFYKSAYQKIGWSYLVNHDVAAYEKAMEVVRKNGPAQTEADKQAQKEAEGKEVPNPEILKARLLFDGGYFDESLKILANVKSESLSKEHALELVYRKARALHEMGDTLRAIESYMTTLSKGKNEPYYYAANAALNLGLIYESKGNKEVARQYFNACLEMDEHEYKASLAQKAKAGLERVK